MNIHFTLDYELFFGERSGTVDNCMIRPSAEFLDLLRTYDIKVTFYVDIGYITHCLKTGLDSENCERTISHLRDLSSQGHEIQLHIHPHWEDAIFDKGAWIFDTTRFRIADFPLADAENIITRYIDTFGLIGLPKPIAYRAGGWCLQPFGHVGAALQENGILIDSTVFKGGYNKSRTHYFDFESAPELNSWKFMEDPLVAEEDGCFVELPISDVAVGPAFFWRMALAKKLGGKRHKPRGDGKAVRSSNNALALMLLKSSRTVASLDGYKAQLMERALEQRLNRFGPAADLVFIGHPKAFSSFSLRQVDGFLRKYIGQHRFVTAAEWYAEHHD